jgi:hypothetical protein
MGIKRIFWIAGVFLTILVGWGCHGSCVTEHSNFDNGGTASFYPVLDSIKIGDTIFFSCEIPTKLGYISNNAGDSAFYDFSGASNVRTDLNISAFPVKDFITSAIDSFIYVPGFGSFTPNTIQGSGAQVITFQELSDKYMFSIGMIAQKKGIYGIAIIDIFQAEKKCLDIAVGITLDKNIDQHFYLVQNLYNDGRPIEPIDQTHSYWFKVY